MELRTLGNRLLDKTHCTCSNGNVGDCLDTLYAVEHEYMLLPHDPPSAT